MTPQPGSRRGWLWLNRVPAKLGEGHTAYSLARLSRLSDGMTRAQMLGPSPMTGMEPGLYPVGESDLKPLYGE